MPRFQNVSPSDDIEEQPTIGLIGMGEMGKMYARRLSEAGWKKINVCDRPEKYEELREQMNNIRGVTVLKDGHFVSRLADFIIYSVEAEFVERVVKEFGPSTKVGAIVAGQISVKTPEREAFEKYLPDDVHIVSIHSLHGPTVATAGQPLVLIRHRAPEWALHLVEDILRPFRSRFVYLSYEDHDIVTANTQAVTHAAFLSMGTAWQNMGTHPWGGALYVSGIEVVKVNITLRIYANKWHVYAGLAILNPSARIQIDQYAKSTTELFKLMLQGDQQKLRTRVYEAREKVFYRNAASTNQPILLSEGVLNQFSLNRAVAEGAQPTPNSHLSLLAMVDSWAALDIVPLAHLGLAGTPVFRMWIGVAEYLFRSPERLDAAIDNAIHDITHRSHDLEFTMAARGWSQCISFGNFGLYEKRFMDTASFFAPRFKEAAELGAKMIEAISQSTSNK